jgi:DNA-binding phage protein
MTHELWGALFRAQGSVDENLQLTNGRNKMTEKLTTYDPANALVDDEEIAFFMAEALEIGDAAYIAKLLVVVARAKGMAEITQKTEFSLE